MRGQLCSLTSSIGSCRIISARAGPTQDVLTISLWNSDHPRSCGANSSIRSINALLSGSSPLVRGQLQAGAGAEGLNRIIPARAGPTLPQVPWPRPCADHPRSCGSNAPERLGLADVAGSSPLVRGQQREPMQVAFNLRIIPARAGPTSRSSSSFSGSADHPRSCGANDAVQDFTGNSYGSSPLVRGQPYQHQEAEDRRRIICMCSIGS